MQAALSASSILAITVALSLSRPRVGRLRINPWAAALLGGLLTALIGLVDHDQIFSCLKLLSLPIVTLVSLMVITIIADHAGIFRQLAAWMAVAAKGSGLRLFVYVFFTGTLAGTLFTNDAAVLIFTPMVFRLIEDAAEPSWTVKNKIPYYFAVLYVANLVGALIISNPINIVVSSVFSIGFAEYAAWMALPTLVSVLTTFAGLVIAFRRWIPRSYRVPSSTGPAVDKRFALASAVVLALALLGFFTERLTGIPIAAVAASCAIVLGAFYWCHTGRGAAGLARIGRAIAWDVLIFVVGIFLVANGLRNAGVTVHIGALLADFTEIGEPAPIFSTGFVAALASAVMNNHPVADLMAMVVRDMPLSAAGEHLMAFAALIGAGLGPKMLPIGSLAALLWFRLLRDRGVAISYRRYVAVGVPVTLAALFLSLATLWAQTAVSGVS